MSQREARLIVAGSVVILALLLVGALLFEAFVRCENRLTNMNEEIISSSAP